MLRIQAYVLWRTLIGVGAVLAVVASVVALVDFVELSRTIGGRADIGFFALVELVVLEAPSVMLVLTPFVFLFGVMGAFVALNRRSELIAMRAAGLSAWRFVFPAALAAALIGFIVMVALNPAAAGLNARFEDRRAALAQEGEPGGRQELWLRQAEDGNQLIIHAMAHDTYRGAIRLKGVSIFIQSMGGADQSSYSRRIEAAEAILTPGFWRLRNVREATPGAGVVRSEQLMIPSTLDRRTAMEKFVAPSAVGFWDLPGTIRSAELAGYSAAAYELRLQQLLALPLLLAAMSILAASFSLRLMRLGDLVGLAAAGVALGFGVFFFNQFCGALGATEVIPVSLAAWATPILALLCGLSLLFWTEDG
jgi:lipopolysaccharide export system permease protein